MKPLLGTAVAARARALPAQAGRGLVQVLIGPDAAPAWRSPRWCQVTYAALVAATVALCVVSLRAAVPGVPAVDGLFHGSVVIVLAVIVPLPLAARYPLVGWRVGWLILVLASVAGGVRSWPERWLWNQVQIAVLVVVFCAAGMRGQRAALWWLWALTLVPWLVWLRRADADATGMLLAAIAFTAVAVAVDSLSSRRRATRALTAQAELTELELARRAVLEERTRIAREMHDVVAHHMSLIAVRAETAPYRLSDLGESARAEFESLSAAAREALADIRRLLGVLRQDQPPTERSPQPRLADLPALVEAARQAGVPVELSAPGALAEVPAGVGVCAYRIVQESLSNASQHAQGAAVTVTVTTDGDAIRLRVSNGPGEPAYPAGNGQVPGGQPGQAQAPGHGQAPEPGQRPGHGLAGMRERIAMLGGSLTAGPVPDGGFVVSAVLPLAPAAPLRATGLEPA